MAFFIFSCNKDETPKEEQEISEEHSAVNVRASNLRNPTTVMYVEVNNDDMRNVGAYTLSDGKPLFDIGVIFAANINYSKIKKKAVLEFNPNVTKVLNQRAITIKPLQQKGIKVLLSILGNHQGAGISNFKTRAKAKDFAQQVANTVWKYALDGIDFDDEYAKYGTNGQPNANNQSFMWLLQELRKLLPNKLITFYHIGPSATPSYLKLGNTTAGQYLDFALQPYYGSYTPFSVPGLGKRRIAPGAIDVKATNANTANNIAKRTKTDNYGALVIYNLDGTDRTAYLSGISKELYGKTTKKTGELYK